jgi:hypothetical protein
VYDPLNELRIKLEMIPKCQYPLVFVRDSLIHKQIVLQSELSSEVLSLRRNIYQPSSLAWQERSRRKNGRTWSFMELIFVPSLNRCRGYNYRSRAINITGLKFFKLSWVLPTHESLAMSGSLSKAMLEEPGTTGSSVLGRLAVRC